MMVGPEHGGVGTATRAQQLVPLYNPFMPLDSRIFAILTSSCSMESVKYYEWVKDHL